MPETEEAIHGGGPQAQIEREAAEKKTRLERMDTLFETWKTGWVEIVDEETIDCTTGKLKVIKTVEEQRSEFFAEIPDGDILKMCRMDEDNPLTIMEKLSGLQSTGVIPALPSLNHVVRAFEDNYRTIGQEICRAVRRGRIK